MSEIIYIRGPFTILCNYCGRNYGEVTEDTEVAARRCSSACVGGK